MRATGMKVVVMGGGLSGLLAALLLARRGHNVTVLERDKASRVSDPEQVFEQWTRPGVPQCRQPHTFLGLAVRVLRDEAPDVLDALSRAGAIRLPMDLGDGPHDSVICSRRLPFEAVLRGVVQMQRGVVLRCQTAVEDLVYDNEDSSQVRGVRLDDGSVIHADLVIDACGRRSPTPRLLALRGLRKVPELGQECGLLYLSRHYRLRSAADYPDLAVPIMASLGWATAMAFPGDRGTFCLLAAVAAIDPLRKTLASTEGFSRLHAMIPLMAPWLRAGEPISGVQMMARVDNRYRRLVDDNGPIVSGLLLLGDAAMHTNPTFGRGVSLAFAHVQHLISTLDGAGSLIDLGLRFDSWTDANIGVWYQLQASSDASMLRRAEAAVRGEELPPPDRTEQIRAVVIELSKQSGPAALKLRRMRNVVARPDEVWSDTAVVAAAEAFLDRREAEGGTTPGPSRLTYASAIERLSA